MAASVNHIIRHAELNLQVAGKDNGMEFQKDAGNWMQVLFEKLEPELNSLAGDGVWLSLDNLDIKVKVQGNRWQQDAWEIVTAKIVEAIKLQANHAIAETGFSVSSSSLHFAEIFLHYLRHGHLPWNTGSEIRAEWHQKVKQLFSRSEPDFAVKLLKLLAQGQGGRKRLLRAVSIFEWADWMKKHSAIPGPNLRPVLEDVLFLLTHYTKSTSASLGKATEEWLLKLLVHKEEEQIIAEATLIKQATSVQLSLLQKALEELEPASPAFIRLKEILKSKLPAETRAKPSAPSAKKEEKGNKPAKPGEENQLAFENIIGDTATGKMAESLTGIYIQNAGLVIVAPFLPMLFKNLGIWVDGRWQNSEQAVCLIHYLASGNASMEEFELVLPKLLCGLDPEEVIDTTGFLPDEKWVHEANELLKSVIEYWSILKDTSVEGLRGSFLTREGRLQKKEADWQLIVEQKPFDMLLQQLPWNISMIQLPWMEGVLYTDWVY